MVHSSVAGLLSLAAETVFAGDGSDGEFLMTFINGLLFGVLALLGLFVFAVFYFSQRFAKKRRGSGQGRAAVLAVMGALGAADLSFAQSHAAPADYSFTVAIPRGWVAGASTDKNAVELRSPASGRVTVTSLGEATHEETRRRFDREVESVGLIKGQAAALQNSGTSFRDGAGGTSYAYFRWDKDERTGLVSCRGKAYRMEGRGAGEADFMFIAASLSCEQDSAAAAAAAILGRNQRSAAPGAPVNPALGPAFDPAEAPPEVQDFLRTTGAAGANASSARLETASGNWLREFLIAVVVFLFLMWPLGLVAMLAMRRSLGRAFQLAAHHVVRGRAAAGVLMVFPLLAQLLLVPGVGVGAVLAMIFLVTTVAGMSAGCVNLAVHVFKIDAVEEPFKAYHTGFALQAALMCIPFLGQLIFLWVVSWGLAGLILLELGYTLPEDEAPLPRVP